MKGAPGFSLILFLLSEVKSTAGESDVWSNWISPSDFNLFPTLPIAAPWSEDEKCRQDSRKLILNLKNKTLWAIQMWDSSATSAFGILQGNKYQLGNYDECMAVTQPLRTQYCHVKIKAIVHQKEAFDGDPYDIDPAPNATVWKKVQDSREDPTKYPRDESQWGLCVPSSCNATEMEKAIRIYLSQMNENNMKLNGTTYEVEIPEDYCTDGTEEAFSYSEMGFWMFTWLLIILVGLATFLDFSRKKEFALEISDSKLKKCLMTFSLKTNVLSLMDRDEGGSKAETDILYGIRFYNVCYIVTDHRMGILMSTVIFNSQKFEEDFRTWLNILLPHGDLLVDTYFFIGGYLATANLLDLYKRRFYNPLAVILHRFFRKSFNLFVDWRGKKLLMLFSLKRNSVKLFADDNADKETKHMKFLHGVKFISIWLIVVDHHIAIFLTSAMHNRQAIEENLRSRVNLVVPHGDLLVDTFFFCGGFLVTYLLLQAFEKRKINIFLAIAMRFLRLAPLYFYIIWFQASVLLRFGSGPAWKLGLKDEIEFCQRNWWANLLFIQNYVNAKEMCMLHAWYIPCDMHFFIFAVCIIILIKKNEKIGTYLLYISTLISIITPGIVTYIHELIPIISFHPKFVDKPRIDPSFEHLYVKSHTRAAVYLLGMITAYHIYRKRNSSWRISTRVSVIGCMVAFGLLFAPMAYGSVYYNPRKKYNLAESIAFAMLRRLSWGLAWVLFMVVNRFGVIPIFGKVFAWKISVPLSKVTYGIYLIHFLIQMADEAKVKIPYQFIPFDMFVKGTNDLVFATGYAFILYLIIELPFRLLFKELLFPTPKEEFPALPELNEVTAKTDLNSSKTFSSKL